MACKALAINNGLVSHHPGERLPTMLQRLKRRARWSEKDKVRQGSGPLDNLVVLFCSLVLLAMVGVALFIYYQHNSPEAVSHQKEPEKQSQN